MRFIYFLAAILILSITTKAQTSTAPLAYCYEPALSPDGAEIAFVSGGDIWTVPAAGGEARLLVSNAATESKPVYAPDGKRLAFVSNRTGNGDIYVLQLQTGITTRITFDDGADELSGWSGDGAYLYFASAGRDVSSMRDIFRVKAGGGTPMPVADNRYITEFQGAPSPDGKSMVFAARGFGALQWWRNGHSHLDESELWLMQGGSETKYTQLTERGARQLWPLWGADGKTVYFISDRSGRENLWMMPVGGEPKQLTQFKDGRLMWASINSRGTDIVFERDFAIWTYNIPEGKASKVNIALRGAPATPPVERTRMTSGFRNLALSPDGKKIAFTAHGDVFVAGAKDGGDATRITTTAAAESGLAWAASSNMLYYISERNGSGNLFSYNFISGDEEQLTRGKTDDAAPLLSPDGKRIAFIRNGRELRVLDAATKKETLVATAYFGRPPFASEGTLAWSPDGKWIAYAGFGAKSLRNIYIVPASGGEARPVSFLANVFTGSVQWSRNGRAILFNTAQRTETGYVAKIDLVPQPPKFREDQFRDLFTEPAPAEKSATAKPADSLLNKPAAKDGTVRIVWEGFRQRLSMLPLGADVDDMALSKDGNTLVVVATAAGQPNLYAYSLDELSKDAGVLRQLTFTPGSKSNLQMAADGKEIFYLEGGRIQSVNLEHKTTKAVAVTAEMDIDFAREKEIMFAEAWEVQAKGFYDSAFHGQNWNAVRQTYAPYAAAVRTPDELRRLLNLMVGELNASHSGVAAPGSNLPFATGRTGLMFDRAVYEQEGKFKIKEVVAFSPAALTERIRPGDYLEGIDGKMLTPSDNIDALLQYKVGRKTMLRISSKGDGANAVNVDLQPVNVITEKALLYKQWVQQCRDYVARKSGGRLGYVHMFDMSQASLDQLYLDMDAENHAREGVVMDVRNNNGGFVNAYALDVLSRRGYMTMTVRDLPPAPARVQLGQRALDAPTVLVTNQHSLSDAEDFTEGYRTLGLGKVVGEPTAGWIIYTSGAQLIDGSTIRLPFIKITDNRGQNMELAPRPVDVPVSNALGAADKDAQLDAAIKTLLQQIDSAKKD